MVTYPRFPRQMNSLTSAHRLEDEMVGGPDKKQLPKANVKRRRAISSDSKTPEEIMYQTRLVPCCLLHRITKC